MHHTHSMNGNGQNYSWMWQHIIAYVIWIYLFSHFPAMCMFHNECIMDREMINILRCRVNLLTILRGHSVYGLSQWETFYCNVVSHWVRLHPEWSLVIFTVRPQMARIINVQSIEARCWREWRCIWSRADKRCSNYLWVINNSITQ